MPELKQRVNGVVTLGNGIRLKVVQVRGAAVRLAIEGAIDVRVEFDHARPRATQERAAARPAATAPAVRDDR